MLRRLHPALQDGPCGSVTAMGLLKRHNRTGECPHVRRGRRLLSVRLTLNSLPEGLLELSLTRVRTGDR